MFLFCLLFSLLPTEAFMLEDIHRHTKPRSHTFFEILQIQIISNSI